MGAIEVWLLRKLGWVHPHKLTTQGVFGPVYW